LIRPTDPAPKPVTVTATRTGLKSAQIQFAPKPVTVTDGIATFLPAHLTGPAEK